ncbi:MAG: hypothetical protein U9R08_06630 [Nanoarchaeota archaeon]|nr:hypothetical protein [Nanoarchaeota archaeon]
MIKKLIILCLIIIFIAGCSTQPTKLTSLLSQNIIPSEYGVHHYTEASYRGTTSREYLFAINNEEISHFNSVSKSTGIGLSYYCYQNKNDDLDDCSCQLIHERKINESGDLVINKTVEGCNDYEINFNEVLTMSKLISKLKTEVNNWNSIKKSNDCYQGFSVQGNKKYEHKVCFKDGILISYDESYEAVERWGDGKTTWEIVSLPVQKLEKEEFN